MTIESASITANTGDGDGTSLHAFGSTLLQNVILAANASPASDCDGMIMSWGHNLIEGSGCPIFGDPTGNILGESPELGALTDNGGPTDTHALLEGSPAIDAGSTSWTLDQRGRERGTDGDCDGVGRIDIGAFEWLGCGVPEPLVYESPDPSLIIDPMYSLGPAGASPYHHEPGSTAGMLFYKVDDGSGAPPRILLSKTATGMHIHF
jgi:hypothetical protein